MNYLFKAAGEELDDVFIGTLLPGIGHVKDHDCNRQMNQSMLSIQTRTAALSSWGPRLIAHTACRGLMLDGYSSKPAPALGQQTASTLLQTTRQRYGQSRAEQSRLLTWVKLKPAHFLAAFGALGDDAKSGWPALVKHQRQPVLSHHHLDHTCMGSQYAICCGRTFARSVTQRLHAPCERLPN